MGWDDALNLSLEDIGLIFKIRAKKNEGGK